MSLLVAQRAGNPAALGAAFSWDPTQLGAQLVGFLDAEDNTKITTVSGAVSAFTDSVSGGTITQATSSSRPLLQTSPLTGRQVVQADGVDDNLTGSVPAAWPLSGATEWIWIGTQEATAGDGVTRNAVAVGSGTAAVSQFLLRVSTNNVFRAQCGNGTTSTFAQVPSSSPATGRVILGGKWDGSTVYASVNGVFGPSAAIAQATNNTRLRLFANATSTPGGFWQGGMSAFLVINGNLAAQDWNNLQVWASKRLGLI